MNIFEEVKKILKEKYGENYTVDDVIDFVDNFIRQINDLVEVVDAAKDILIEVLEGIKYSLKYHSNRLPHNISKDKLKKAG